ncbi:hypothetical protein ACG3SL_09930 [Sphingomonas sp. CJ20]
MPDSGALAPIAEENGRVYRHRRVLAGLGLLAATGALATLAARDAFAAIYRVGRPAWVLAARPWDPVALAVSTDRGLAKDPTAFPADGALRAALAGDPLNAEVLRLAGLRAETGGDPQRAHALISLSERLSRRDLAGQIWLIEDAVRRDEVAAALVHYDRALSVHRAAWEPLFPVLSSAMRHPGIREALIPYVRDRRAWAIPLLSHAATQAEPPAPRNVASLLRRAGLLGAPRSGDIDALAAALLRRLVSDGDYPGAFALAAEMAGTGAASLSDVAVTPATTQSALQPLTWQLGTGDGVLARLDERNRVRIRASRGRQAMALSRVLALRPGRYELGMAAHFADSEPIAAAEWAWTCVDGGRGHDAGRASVETGHGARTQVFGFDISEDCPAIRLELTVTGDDDLRAGEMVIDALALRRVSPPPPVRSAR